MLLALRTSWALFMGLGFMMLGLGLQGSLVAIRAQIEDFGNSTTGVIMGAYFAGFFLGSLVVPKIISRVGHVRVFAALAAIASFAVLVYPIAVDPIVWAVMRLLTGIAYAGLYIVVESWLNDKATNKTRGQMLAIYMIVSLIGMSGGQLMLNLYNPADFQLFTIVSVLISAAAIPVLVSAARAPEFDAPETLSPIKLYKISPLGTIGMVLVGMTAGMFMGMGPAYAFKMHGTEFASFFMATIFIGGFLFTWPIGSLSDRFDRRTVIFYVAVLCGLAAICGLFFDDATRVAESDRVMERILAVEATVPPIEKVLLLVVALVFGGFALPLYSLCLAHTNDYLTSKQMVTASSTLIAANGVGAMMGPNIAGALMDAVGTPGFFVALASVSFALAVFAAYRMTRRPAIANEEQGAFVPMDAHMTAVAATLNPEVEWPEESIQDQMENGDEIEETWDDMPRDEEDEPEEVVAVKDRPSPSAGEPDSELNGKPKFDDPASPVKDGP